MKIPSAFCTDLSTQNIPPPPPPPPPLPPPRGAGGARPRLVLPTLHADMNEACRVVGEIVEVLREKVEVDAHVESDEVQSEGKMELPPDPLLISSSSSSSSSFPSSIAFSSSSVDPPPPPSILPPPPSIPPPPSSPLDNPFSTTTTTTFPSLLDAPIPSCLAPPLPPKLAPPVPRQGVLNAAKMTKPETCQNIQTRREAENLSDLSEWRKGQLLFHFRKTESVLQIGPTCGLVALRMLCGVVSASSSSSSSSSSAAAAAPSVEALLSHAQSASFSSQGEMFSCDAMKELVDAFAAPEARARVARRPDEKTLLRHLLAGGAALVPYDKDRNYGPTRRGGHKAHWALILGCVVSLPEELVRRLVEESRANIDLQFEASKTSVLHAMESSDLLFLDDPVGFGETESAPEIDALGQAAVGAIERLRRPSLFRTARPTALLREKMEAEAEEKPEAEAKTEAKGKTEAEDVAAAFHDESRLSLVDEVMEKMLGCRLVALQGKSRNLLFWSAEELLGSNKQLTSYDISAVEGELIFPDGNVEKGLCDQIVLVDLP